VPTHKKECLSCSDEFITPWSTAKLCPPCRNLRDIPHKGLGKARQCNVCARDFWPVRGTYRTCYHCVDLQAGRRPECPECNVCGQRNRVAPGLVHTCLGCVQATEANRAKYLQSLYKRREVNRARK